LAWPTETLASMFDDVRTLASLYEIRQPQMVDTHSAFSYGATWDSSSGGFLYAPDAIWNSSAPADREAGWSPVGSRTTESVYSFGTKNQSSVDPGHATCVASPTTRARCGAVRSS